MRAERPVRLAEEAPAQPEPPTRAARAADTLAGLAVELARPAPELIAVPRAALIVVSFGQPC
jgi:hypothetical protein